TNSFSCRRLKAHNFFFARHSLLNTCSFRTPKLINNFSSKSKNYYDILKITPNASQSDIKAAYFKLSKLYHPDVNKDDENSAHRFREVTEAYEMLSNVQFRKKYDAEGFNLNKIHNFEEIFKTTTEKKENSAYNYDEWLKGHYSELFRRRDEVKNTQKNFDQRLSEYRENRRRAVYSTLLLTFVSFTIFAMVYALEKSMSLDHGPKIVRKKDKSEANNH
uniref:J domain-containing protein n=1 Tax=Strigamia maritima TaxID=126957 RepID=T1JKS8_STRMM